MSLLFSLTSLLRTEMLEEAPPAGARPALMSPGPHALPAPPQSDRSKLRTVTSITHAFATNLAAGSIVAEAWSTEFHPEKIPQNGKWHKPFTLQQRRLEEAVPDSSLGKGGDTRGLKVNMAKARLSASGSQMLALSMNACLTTLHSLHTYLVQGVGHVPDTYY